MNILLINIIGFLLIGLIIYWFWFSKPKPVKASTKEIDIIVDNGVYSPSRIEIKKGDTVFLNFLRKDPSPCAEKVIFSDLNISEDLPVNHKTRVEIKIQQQGEYEFTCQMQMYRGTLIVQ